jgi:hypothetical protein
MNIREVTFEELLAILRSPPELVVKTAAENPHRDNTDHARRARESRGSDCRPRHRCPVLPSSAE